MTYPTYFLVHFDVSDPLLAAYLSKIDADTGAKGNQAFVYIGSDLFSGTQGEVRFESSILGVNTGIGTTADMQIKLNGVTDFSPDFLIL